jgi:transcriptional regulator GlxA family with amidase domain
VNIAVLTFDAFNELDSFVAAALLNRLSTEGVSAYITAPSEQIVSKNGIVVQAQRPLAFAREADAVIIGSGMKSSEIAADPKILSALQLDPSRQLIASQCSGALILAGLGLVQPGHAVCTDLVTAPMLKAQGYNVAGKPFHVEGNVASAGGCLSAQYLAAWIAGRLLGVEAAERMIWGAAPVGEKDAWVKRSLSVVRPFLRTPEGVH